MKKRYGAFGAIAAILLSMFFGVQPASAVASSVCGSGYTQVATDNAYTNAGGLVGTIYVFRKSSTNTTCAVMEGKNGAYNYLAYKSAWVQNQSTLQTDSSAGNFYFYAGPVYITQTAGQCMLAVGKVDYNGNRYSTNASSIGSTYCA